MNITKSSNSVLSNAVSDATPAKRRPRDTSLMASVKAKYIFERENKRLVIFSKTSFNYQMKTNKFRIGHIHQFKQNRHLPQRGRLHRGQWWKVYSTEELRRFILCCADANGWESRRQFPSCAIHVDYWEWSDGCEGLIKFYAGSNYSTFRQCIQVK